MFTGIIKSIGEVKEITNIGSNRTFYIKSSLAPQLKIDESLSHNGICLTIEDIIDETYKVTAIAETLLKTNAGNWNTGDLINLEPSLRLNDLLSGHLVQGHVDGTGICILREEKDGSVEFVFEYDKNFAALIIEKGSICINGVSLTAFNVTENQFEVAIIPYTFNNTNFHLLKEKDIVNLEFDILGKYITRIGNLNKLSFDGNASKQTNK